MSSARAIAQTQSLRAIQVLDEAHWNELLRAFSTPHPMQTWQWGEAKQIVGERVERWCVMACDAPILLAQTFLKSRAWLPINIAWVPRGPIYEDKYLAAKAIKILGREFRLRACRAIVVQPYSLELANRPSLLRRIPAQRDFTFVVDLDASLDATERLLRNKGMNRFNREAGVIVEDSSDDAVEPLIDLYAALAQRKQFRPYGGAALIRSVWKTFRTPEQADVAAHCFQADVHGKVAGSSLVLRVGCTAHYMWAAFDYELRNLGAGEAMQWEIMKRMRASGVRFYDLEGADQKNNPGVYKFKKKLGGTLIERPPMGFRLL
ncbi:MAG TPA: GNAT family N-acetyltransferase [Clostridia bacterium]|nr:GNAT family N-acetyltransferase [Clostridia bacterium]